MSLDHIYTPEEENTIFGQDATLTYTEGGLDIQVDDSGDINLSDGLSELVVSYLTMVLTTTRDYISGEGELPFHPTFGSALPSLLLSVAPTEEQIEVILAEIYHAVFTQLPDLVTLIEFPLVEMDQRRLTIHINVHTVTSSVGNLVLVI